MKTIKENGNIEYRNAEGQRHREDGPAVERANGYKAWFLNDKLHREDGPAVEYANGTKSWFLNDKLHREDGPAIEYADGDKAWYLNDQLHREDGPAVECADGDKSWWLNGVEYSEHEFNEKMNKEYKPKVGDKVLLAYTDPFRSENDEKMITATIKYISEYSCVFIDHDHGDTEHVTHVNNLTIKPWCEPTADDIQVDAIFNFITENKNMHLKQVIKELQKNKWFAK